MAIPEQIRKQTEAVQELYKQLNDDGDNGANNADGATPPADSAGANPPAADDANTGTNSATQSPADGHTSGDDNDPNSETYAQKWRTLQGMYNAEVPRLHAQNREITQRMQQMEQLLATMSAAKTQQPVQAAPAPVLVTDEDKAEYGESIDMMRKVSREELIPVAQEIASIKRLLAQFQMNVMPQVQNLTQKQAMSAEQQFWSDLTRAVPNWREVNDNADFQDWLLNIDPLSGISRQTILDDAQRNLDVPRVVNFFRTWNELNGQANVAQNPNRQASASELERQVTPGRSRNTGAPNNGGAKTYTPEDIEKFFADVRKGRYKGREAERDRLERDIFAAQRENRIVNHA